MDSYTPQVDIQKSIKILSFDGGGSRCIFSIKILDILCKKLYGSSDEKATAKFIGNFDLIAGTSGGSILASLLCIGYSIDNIRNIFYEFNTKIFSNTWTDYIFKCTRYYKTGDFYSSQLLSQFLSNFFGNKQLIHLNKNLMIIATNVTTNLFEPYIFRSYQVFRPVNKISKFKGNSNESIINAVCASSAAPTYFQPFRDIDNHTYIDGGLIANNPTMLSIMESRELWDNCNIQLVLSIGTGNIDPIPGSTSLTKLPGELLTLITNSDLIHHEVVEWLYDFSRDTNYFRFSPDGLGSVKLDESDLNILINGELETDKYMNKQVEQILKFVNKIDG